MIRGCFVLMILLISSCSLCKKKVENNHLTKSISIGARKNIEAMENRNDSLKWDYKLFNEDIKYVDEIYNYPIEFGVFPTPKYSLLGKDSFKGIGYYRNKIEVNGKSLLTVAFFLKNNGIYKDKLKESDSYVFFKMVLLLGDSKTDDEINDTMISSRNHPSYIGQGSCITSNFKVDYLSFITPNITSYAIINMRLFDLSQGNTIIITPQKDKSFRSLQLSSKEILTSNNLEIYFNNLLHKSLVNNFLNNPENVK